MELKRILRWGVPLLLTAYFSLAAVHGTSARYGTIELLVIVALYALLSGALFSGAGALTRLGQLPGWLGAFGLTFSKVWHLREQIFLPGSILSAVILAILLAFPYQLLQTWLFNKGRDAPRVSAFLVLALAGLVLWAGAYQASRMLRWHLLRHNTMLGTPAYYLLGTSVQARQQALFDRLQQDLPPAPAFATPETIAAPDGAVKPNIVFVMLDTLRADALAAYGGDPELMPRLNSFLDESYRFTDVWANASWTRPSVASFFTGLLQEEHGARRLTDVLAADQVTLSEIFSERGYGTAAIVTNLAAVSRESGFAQGFDSFLELDDRPYARAEKVKRAVFHWLGQAKTSDERWFLYLHFFDPHEPYLSGKEPARKLASEYWDAYREELRYLDRHLSETLDALRRQLTGPTHFFITSDHGEEFFEHEIFGHGYNLYGEVVEIPAALHTGQGSGDVSARLEARDFFDLLTRAAADGSIEEWARRRARDQRYASTYHHTEGRLLLRPYLRRICTRAIEQGDYKLIWSAYGDTYGLYNLARDPGELRNLAAAEPERVARMAAALDPAVRFWSFAEGLELSDEALERLRTLGYAE